MYCYLCRENGRDKILTGYFCSSCKRIQDLISIYQDRVNEVLEEVLVRSPKQQDNKLRTELKKEIEKKEYALRSKEKAITK
tara:strand:- start:8613 stop:8855 length:243 start_codon:yes stop_codon:yes gene_type:complete